MPYKEKRVPGKNQGETLNQTLDLKFLHGTLTVDHRKLLSTQLGKAECTQCSKLDHCQSN